MISYYKQKNSSVFKELIKLYCLHGFYKEKLVSIVKGGEKGKNEIKKRPQIEAFFLLSIWNTY